VKLAFEYDALCIKWVVLLKNKKTWLENISW
jgi:hypothetical protein